LRVRFFLPGIHYLKSIKNRGEKQLKNSCEEIGGGKNSRAPKSAKGMMQLIPATAERFNVKNAFNASQNM